MTNKDTQDGKILTATYTLNGWQLSSLVPVLNSDNNVCGATDMVRVSAYGTLVPAPVAGSSAGRSCFIPIISEAPLPYWCATVSIRTYDERVLREWYGVKVLW